MAVSGSQALDITYTAVASLTIHKYGIVISSGTAADGRAAVGQSVNATNSTIVGVLQNAPQVNEYATVRVSGISKVVADTSITIGVLLTSSASGRATAAASGDMVIGRALAAAGAAGDIITMLVQPSYRNGGAI